MDKWMFEFLQEWQRRESIHKPFKLSLDENIQWHHISSRNHSGLEIPLFKSLHEVVSDRVNSLSPQARRNRLRFCLESISALLELLAFLLRVIAAESDIKKEGGET